MLKISFCLIAKNEARCLRRCLESIKGVADEIVVIDTGSTDATKAIAAEFTDKIFDAAWTDDYSAARNEYFKYATGDMIFSIDADEWLAPGQAKNVEAIKAQSVGLYLVLIASVTTDRRVFKGKNYRLFPNDKECLWHNIVHENITNPAGKYPQASSRIMLLHDGYMAAIRKEKGTESRNMRLLKKQLELTPNNPYFHYHIGMQYYEEKAWKESAEHYRRALEIIEAVPASEFSNYIPSCYDGIAAVCQAADDAALYASLQGIETIASSFYINLGAYAEKNGKPAEALAFYDKAIEHCKDGYKLISCDTSACTWRPYACKGYLLFNAGRIVEAIDCFRLALLEEPGRIELEMTLSRLYCKAERLGLAEKIAEAIVEKDGSAGNQIHLADIYLNNGKADAGIELYTKHASPEHILDIKTLMERAGKQTIANKLSDYLTHFDYVHFAAVEPRTDCVSVIIPTLAKANQEYFKGTLEKLSACAAVKNVIIMDNTAERVYEKYRAPNKVIIACGENRYVNPAWNYGMELSDTEYYLLLNDDVICGADIINECVSVLDADKDFDILLAKTAQETLAEYTGNERKNEAAVYVNVPIGFVEGGWFVFGRRAGWRPIPAELHIFFGDNWIYDNAVFNSKRKIGKIISNYISHFTSTAVSAEGIYAKGILEKEGSAYERIRKNSF